jgi:hypothetical protein
MRIATVGDALEVFVEAYLATHQKPQAETVWLVGQVPIDVRRQLNLPTDVKGIDGVFRTRTGRVLCCYLTAIDQIDGLLSHRQRFAYARFRSSSQQYSPAPTR